MKASFTYNGLNNTKSTPHAIDNLWPNFRVNISCNEAQKGVSSWDNRLTLGQHPPPPPVYPMLEHNWGQMQVDVCRRKHVIFMQK